MKQIAVLIGLLLVVLGNDLNAQPRNIWDMSIGKKYLTHFEGKIKEVETFTFKANVNKTYEVITTSSESCTIVAGSIKITLNGNDEQSFIIEGNGELITILITPRKKSTVTIGVFLK